MRGVCLGVCGTLEVRYGHARTSDTAHCCCGFVDEAAFVAWCERPEVAVTMPLFRRAVLGVGGDAIELAAQRAAAVRDAHSAAKAAAAAARKGK